MLSVWIFITFCFETSLFFGFLHVLGTDGNASRSLKPIYTKRYRQGRFNVTMMLNNTTFIEIKGVTLEWVVTPEWVAALFWGNSICFYCFQRDQYPSIIAVLILR